MSPSVAFKSVFILLCCLSIAPTRGAEVMGFWPLSESGGNVARDSQGHWHGWYRGGVGRGERGRPGTSWDGCVRLDGESGHIMVPHHDGMMTDAGSVSLWILAEDASKPQGLLSKDATNYGDGGHLTLHLAQNKIVARLQSVGEDHELKSAKIESGQWTHVVVSFGPVGFRLFVEGKLVDQGDYQGGLGESSGGGGNREPLVLGASCMNSDPLSPSPLNSYFGGKLDDITWYSGELSDEEVSSIWHSQTPVYRDIAEAIMLHGPSAWWPLHEPNDASRATDRVGRFPGEYHVHGDERFDGDDHVNLKNIDVSGEQVTIVGWARPTSFETSDARIISKATGTDAQDHFWMLSTVKQGDDHVLRGRLRTIGEGTAEIAGSRPIELGVWMMTALTYDGRHVRLYQNDELVAEREWKGELATNSHCQAWIGDNPSGQGDRPFRGDIEHVALFDRALELPELQAIYLAKNGAPILEVPVPPIVRGPTIKGPTIEVDPNVAPLETPHDAPQIEAANPTYREVWVERTVYHRCYCAECRVYYLKPVKERIKQLQPVPEIINTPQAP
jgi:hypothetical protein